MTHPYSTCMDYSIDDILVYSGCDLMIALGCFIKMSCFVVYKLANQKDEFISEIHGSQHSILGG